MKTALVTGVTGQDGSYLADFLLEKGYEPALGARPLRRAIQKLIEDPLADLVMKGKVHTGSEVKISKRSGELVFEEKSTETSHKS